jgi:hypothetical protein
MTRENVVMARYLKDKTHRRIAESMAFLFEHLEPAEVAKLALCAREWFYTGRRDADSVIHALGDDCDIWPASVLDDPECRAAAVADLIDFKRH